MALHFHQPVGNFESIFERANRLCYNPFLKLLSNYPNIQMTFHVSGCLLDYLEDKHHETIDLIKQMVSRGQIEMMSGGYYEPILTAIPERDLIGQILMMSEYIQKRFYFKPKGIWIPERVWESRIAKGIYDSGIRYSILDDTHFIRAGIKKENLHGYFLTGKGTKKIAIFPSDKTLRYIMPFKEPKETIEYFKNTAKDKEKLLFIYGDDGEKFGEWPGTHEWVYEKNWLKNFFDTLEQNRQWIELVKFSDYLKCNKPIDTIEIPPGSYEEMMEWSEGNWLNFLKKYPETNQVHKKMVYVSDKIASLEKKIPKSDLAKLKQARKELYKSQCNCGYWHGVFGGLYLFHLRNAIYNHLITADKIADEILHKKEINWLDLKQIDFNFDGRKKILMENKSFFLCLDPQDGGVLKELDYRPISFNLINALSRKEESYHKKILDSIQENKDNSVKTIHDDFREVKPILKKKIIYDKFSRYCLRNYFLKEDLAMDDFVHSNFRELGDFAQGEYLVKKGDKSLTLERSSKILNIKLKITKQITIKSEKEIEIVYSIENKNSASLDAIFGVEFNITMPFLNSDRYSYCSNHKILGKLNTAGSMSGISSFGISDSEKAFGVNFAFQETPMDICYFPVETVSQSERAYELNYQCSCILPRWKPDFSQKKSWDLKINWQML
jgi:alpha-amylase